MSRPRIFANFALTADGKVSTRNFTPTGFTSAEDKRRLLAIRARGDALLVGARTLAADTMAMRLPDEKLRQQRVTRGQSPEPRAIIASNRGKIDPTGKSFRSPTAPPLVFSTRQMPAGTRTKLAQKAELWIFESATVPLEAMLRILGKDYGFRSLVCEGGPTLFRALLEIDAIDELHLTWAPTIFGGAKAPTLTGLPGEFLPKTREAKLLAMETIGQECFLHYKLKKTGLRTQVKKKTKPKRVSGSN